MNWKSNAIILLLLFASGLIYSQGIVNNDYVKLKSSGEFPSEWKYSLQKGSPVNFEKEYSNNKKNNDFLVQNDFVLKRLYNSGYLYYGDSITAYINEVADKLLSAANPELVGKFRFYTAGSQYVNASSMSQGVIFVNVGLIAQLSNEAELAFVLAHEISHNLLHHSAVRYEERGEQDEDSYSNYDDVIFKNNYNSREDETEADENAIKELYSKTNYNYKAAVSIFDVLQYSYLPLDNIPLSKNYFDIPTLKMQSKAFLGGDSLVKIAVDENYDEKKSTHPKCVTRRQTALDLISNIDDGSARVYYTLGEDRFKRIRDYARFETIYEQITAREITTALYNIYVVEQSYPGNKFLETSKAYCLYIAQKYRNRKNTSKVISSYKKVEGESGQINYFLKNVDIKDLNVLAVRNLYDLVKKYPGDNFLMAIYTDALKDMVIKQDIKLKSLKKISKQNEVVDTAASEATGSKYTNIKKGTISEDYKYAFHDILKDPLFYEKLSEFEDLDEKTKSDDEKDSEKYSKSDYKNIVIINPEFHKVSDNDESKNMIVDDKKRESIPATIQESASKMNMKVKVIDNGIKDNSTELYNDKVVIINSFSEILNEDFSGDEIIFNLKYSEHLVTSYDTRFYGWSALATGREKGLSEYESDIITFIYPILFMIPGLFMPDYSTSSLLLVIDMKAGKKVGVFSSTIGNGENAMNCAIYNTLYKFRNMESLEKQNDDEDDDEKKSKKETEKESEEVEEEEK